MIELKAHLDELRAQGMFRSLRMVEGMQGRRVCLDGRSVLLLCSNNYLGLASHPALIEAAREATSRYGVGTGGSRLISGSMEPHHRFEERIADFKKTEAALMFNSGYAANTGVLQGMTGPQDVIFSDELNHASIVDGCRLAKARVVVYPHGDVNALRALMEAEAPQRKGRWLIVTDGVFSMDGDMAPLSELVALKEEFDALLMIDDAHGTGVLGDTGRGTGEHFGCLDKIDLHMGTLGKALGGCGAYLAASRTIVDTLINRSRSFIFSTSLAPAVPAAAVAALDVVDSAEGRQLREGLERNCTLFVDRLHQNGVDGVESSTQIIPIPTADPKPTMAAAARLLEKGVFIQGIRPPTVAVGQCRLRATVMAVHRRDELLDAADQIAHVLKEV